MTAMVETRHRAECFECGWMGEETVFFNEADDEGDAHNQAVHFAPDVEIERQ